jgi:ketosteroid isomerase-like protein
MMAGQGATGGGHVSGTDVVRAFYDNMAAGDVEAALELLDHDVEWTEAAGFPYAGVYHGPAAVLEGVFRLLGAEWDGFQSAVDVIVADGDQVAALGWYSGTYKKTGKAFRARFVHWFTVPAQTITRFEQIVDSSEVNVALTPA